MTTTGDQGAEGLRPAPSESIRWRVLVTAGLASAAAGRLYWGRGVSAAALLLVCLFVTALLVPWVARLARRYDIVALPGGRDVHLHPTPRGGGLAVFIPMAAILALWCLGGSTRVLGLLIGATLIFCCGLLDDVRRVSPGLKVLFQLLAGGILILAGYRLPVLGIPGVGELALGSFEIPLILCWVVLVTNAVNLSDGLDGLATSLTVLGLAVLVLAGVPSALPIALAGACLGFLYHNFPRARIFLGDSGSLLLGFLLAGLTLEIPPAANVPLTIAALAYPLGDVMLVMLRRWVRGKPIMAPDRSHVHHKALLYLGKPFLALCAVMGFAVLHALAGVMAPGVFSIGFSVVLWFVLAVVLVGLGQHHPGSTAAPPGQGRNGRRRMRRLHGLQTYMSESIALSQDREELAFALQHFVEGAGFCAVAVNGLRVAHRQGCVCAGKASNGVSGNPTCQEHPVGSRSGDCSWTGLCSTGNAHLDQERETVATAILRLAAAHLEGLSSAPGG